MKILLIASSVEDGQRSPVIQKNSHYPIGLAYLYSYLEKQGYSVELLFLNDYSHEECNRIVFKKLKEFKPDVVGFNMLTHNRVSTYSLIEYIYEYYPSMKILLGGIHASIMYKQLVARYPYVIVVIGEGEITTDELLKKIKTNKPLNEVQGIAFFQDGGVVVTSPRPLIEDLDQLPFPKHELFFNSERTNFSFLTSRGCPFNCSFCVLDVISRRKVRYRSIENVLDEIEFLIKNNPRLEIIWIHDDAFFLKNERTIAFCEGVIKRKIKSKFICSARFKPLSKELVVALERAGFIQVLFGLESGSPSVLKLAKKCVTQDDVLLAIKLFKDSPIKVTSFLIVGLFGEDWHTIRETSNFVMKMQRLKYSYFDDIGICNVYPGTQICALTEQAGFLNNDYWLTDKPVPFFTVEHDFQELLKYKEYILNHIALRRIFTWKGFLCQFKMLPYIVKFLAKNQVFVKLFKQLKVKLLAKFEQ